MRAVATLPHVSVTDELTASDRETVLSGLRAYNTDKTGYPPPRPLGILVKGEDGETRGGLIGRTGYGWLAIELFYLPEDCRRSGLGLDIIRLAEQEAIERGCHSARVETASFQALGFYQKAGYSVFGTLERYPDHQESYYLRKALAVGSERA